MIKKINTLFEAIKFEHTIFALPFAYLGIVFIAVIVFLCTCLAIYVPWP